MMLPTDAGLTALTLRALHRELTQSRTDELRRRMSEGGIREATIRALLYVGMAEGLVDERGFESIRRIRQSSMQTEVLPLAAFKTLVRDQYSMLLIDQSAAVASIPSMLPPEPDKRAKAVELITQVIEASGAPSPNKRARLEEIANVFRNRATAPVAAVNSLKVSNF
jgi:hypothetical protein